MNQTEPRNKENVVKRCIIWLVKLNPTAYLFIFQTSFNELFKMRKQSYPATSPSLHNWPKCYKQNLHKIEIFNSFMSTKKGMLSIYKPLKQHYPTELSAIIECSVSAPFNTLATTTWG